MKTNAKILGTLLGLCVLFSTAARCQANALPPLAAFKLDSALGNRTLAAQSETPALQPRKSPNEAFLYSLVVPGMGQLYAGAKRGYLYTAVDIGLLTTYFLLRRDAADTREAYRDVVRQNVVFIGAGSFEDWDPIEDFEHATQYETWNHVYDSEATRTRTGKWYWGDLDPSLKDEPDSTIEFESPHRLEAFALRQEANDRFQRARTVLGLVILNHLVSAVDARITTKRRNTAETQPANVRVGVRTEWVAGYLTGTLVLQKRF